MKPPRSTALLLALAALLAPAPASAQESATPTTTIAPSPTPTSCTSGHGFGVSDPSSRSVVAGDQVTVTASFRGGLRQAALTAKGYDWTTPTEKGSLPLTSPSTVGVAGDTALAEGETASRSWTFAPTTNTRVSYDHNFQTTCGLYGHGALLTSHVIDVAPRLTLHAVRNGPRDYTFSGAASRSGQVVSLYRVTREGDEVLTAQARATDAQTWAVRRVFTGAGRFDFVLRTGRDMASAPGWSNVRSTVIH